MDKRRIVILIAFALIALIASVANPALAYPLFQATDTPTPTSTWTPRPTYTATATSAVTRTPLPTPTDTPEPLSFTISQMGVASDTIGAPFNPKDWKTILDTFTGVGTYADQAKTDIDVRATSSPLEIDQTDPISMARGFAVVMSDFEWVGILFGWFTFAFILIIAVEGIRLIVSLWGVIQRIIDLIKLIPFV